MKLSATLGEHTTRGWIALLEEDGAPVGWVKCRDKSHAILMVAHLNRDPEDVNELILTGQWARNQLDNSNLAMKEVIEGWDRMTVDQRYNAEWEWKKWHNRFIDAVEACKDA